MEESLGMRLYIYIPKDLVHIIVLVLEFVGKQFCLCTEQLVLTLSI